MLNFDQELDLTGLNCPMPILRTKKALASVEPGHIFRVITSDPGSLRDFEAFAKLTVHELLESGEDNGNYFFLLKRGE